MIIWSLKQQGKQWNCCCSEKHNCKLTASVLWTSPLGYSDTVTATEKSFLTV